MIAGPLTAGIDCERWVISAGVGLSWVWAVYVLGKVFLFGNECDGGGGRGGLLYRLHDGMWCCGLYMFWPISSSGSGVPVMKARWQECGQGFTNLQRAM